VGPSPRAHALASARAGPPSSRPQRPRRGRWTRCAATPTTCPASCSTRARCVGRGGGLRRGQQADSAALLVQACLQGVAAPVRRPSPPHPPLSPPLGPHHLQQRGQVHPRVGHVQAHRGEGWSGRGGGRHCAIPALSRAAHAPVGRPRERSLRPSDATPDPILTPILIRVPAASPAPPLQVQTFRREHDRFWILSAHPDINLLAAGHDGCAFCRGARRGSSKAAWAGALARAAGAAPPRATDAHRSLARPPIPPKTHPQRHDRLQARARAPGVRAARQHPLLCEGPLPAHLRPGAGGGRQGLRRLRVRGAGLQRRRSARRCRQVAAGSAETSSRLTPPHTATPTPPPPTAPQGRDNPLIALRRPPTTTLNSAPRTLSYNPAEHAVLLTRWGAERGAVGLARHWLRRAATCLSKGCRKRRGIGPALSPSAHGALMRDLSLLPAATSRAAPLSSTSCPRTQAAARARRWVLGSASQRAGPLR
jgi:hypothetical protein